MVKVRKLIWSGATLAMPVLLALGVAGSASAAVSPHAAATSASHVVTIKVPMTYVPPARSGRPNNTVHGNCGSAFLGLAPIGEGKVVVNMGFDINRAAYGESWVAAVNGHGNSGGGALPPWSSKSWDYDYQVTTGPGFVAASAEYFAYLYGGGECVSSGLGATTYAN
jgi:hypothetical protein